MGQIPRSIERILVNLHLSINIRKSSLFTSVDERRLRHFEVSISIAHYVTYERSQNAVGLYVPLRLYGGLLRRHIVCYLDVGCR